MGSIEEYQFRGANALKKIAEESLGSLILRKDQLEKAPDKKPIEGFLKLLQIILDIVTKFNQLVPWETITKLLPPGN